MAKSPKNPIKPPLKHHFPVVVLFFWTNPWRSAGVLLTGADKLDPLSFVAVVSPICGFCLVGPSTSSCLADGHVVFVTCLPYITGVYQTSIFTWWFHEMFLTCCEISLRRQKHGVQVFSAGIHFSIQCIFFLRGHSISMNNFETFQV